MENKNTVEKTKDDLREFGLSRYSSYLEKTINELKEQNLIDEKDIINIIGESEIKYTDAQTNRYDSIKNIVYGKIKDKINRQTISNILIDISCISACIEPINNIAAMNDGTRKDLLSFGMFALAIAVIDFMAIEHLKNIGARKEVNARIENIQRKILKR